MERQVLAVMQITQQSKQKILKLQSFLRKNCPAYPWPSYASLRLASLGVPFSLHPSAKPLHTLLGSAAYNGNGWTVSIPCHYSKKIICEKTEQTIKSLYLG